MQRCDVVVWIRMDHYERMEEDQVCKSANYWKSLSELPETPPPGALYLTPQHSALYSRHCARC